jgi:hypothetical protein
MITQQKKEESARHLIEQMNREELNTRATAGFLNLNPIYISMVQNKTSWDSMSRVSWERIIEWHDTREKISEFRIPEGEEIWKPKEKINTTEVSTPVIKEKKEKKKPDKIKRDPAPPVTDPTPGAEKNDTSGAPEHLPAAVNAELLVSEPETARLRVALDIEINLVINGQRINLN